MTTRNAKWLFRRLVTEDSVVPFHTRDQLPWEFFGGISHGHGLDNSKPWPWEILNHLFRSLDHGTQCRIVSHMWAEAVKKTTTSRVSCDHGLDSLKLWPRETLNYYIGALVTRDSVGPSNIHDQGPWGKTISNFLWSWSRQPEAMTTRNP